jgi:hypothetical protein
MQKPNFKVVNVALKQVDTPATPKSALTQPFSLGDVLDSMEMETKPTKKSNNKSKTTDQYPASSDLYAVLNGLEEETKGSSKV